MSRSANWQREECVPTRRLSALVLYETRHKTHFDFERLAAAEWEVVHLHVSVVGITTALVLNKCKASTVSEFSML